MGRNYGLIQALETALRNVKTDNERHRAELGRKDEKIEALKSLIRSLRAECNNYKPALQNLELYNRFLPAELRRDADKISLMRKSILKLRAKLSRRKHAMARLAVFRGWDMIIFKNRKVSK